MALATSLSTEKMSVSLRSNVSAQRCESLTALISCTFTRTESALFCTLPSRMFATPSRLPSSLQPLEPCLSAPAETSAAPPHCQALRCRDSLPTHVNRVSPPPHPGRADASSNGRAVPGLPRHASKGGCARHPHNPSPA